MGPHKPRTRAVASRWRGHSWLCPEHPAASAVRLRSFLTKCWREKAVISLLTSPLSAGPHRKAPPSCRELWANADDRHGTEAMTGPVTRGRECCPGRLCPRGATCRLVSMVRSGGQGSGCPASHCHCPFCRVLSLEASPTTEPALKGGLLFLPVASGMRQEAHLLPLPPTSLNLLPWEMGMPPVHESDEVPIRLGLA